ncbi:hypothetical protein, variant 1 [Aphanomyces astaci]|uniref:MOSC domain-containing protein n=1 Tax=Aphanomyces astaci TaxID=112090 RepID=W4HDY1_APHAT|nr:hypothetical protein, variant 1 [Aphanomyces astaci]ETV89358.1 hypothetical protein, variant 1 [Aphanomyces astaci]|eukprot:XP_009821758.1 hypothetical protein, variant 1 [Aphanomyces astaci]
MKVFFRRGDVPSKSRLQLSNRIMDEMGEGYGYGSIDGEDVLSKLRGQRFRHLEGQVYLDHAGATVYGSHQVEEHAKLLMQNVFGNPHSSSSPSSQRTTDSIDSVRRDLAAFFNTTLEEYDVVFTSGTTAGLKLIGESFPFSRQSSFAYSMDSHNSVLGIRSYAAAHDARIFALPVDVLDSIGQQPTSSLPPLDDDSRTHEVCNLVAFPGECNFSGAKHSLSTIDWVHHHNALNDMKTLPEYQVNSNRPSGDRPLGKWFVLLDAAKLAATNPVDLSKYKPDFMVMSFYKLFGYPSGLGALLIRRSSAPYLAKPYHGGGTLAASFPTLLDASRPHAATHRRFEDGTLPYLSILACTIGLQSLRNLTMPAIQRHVAALTTYAWHALTALRHANGARVCTIYGTHHRDPDAGSIIACNFSTPDGAWVGYSEFSTLAALHDIHVRTGCFCNPGACQAHLGLTTDEMLAHMAQGHVCGDAMDIIHNRPTGAIRVSFGYMSTQQDVDAFIMFVATYFVSSRTHLAASRLQVGHDVPASIRLVKIAVFPIKSCGAMHVDRWRVGARGLLFDREWALVDPATGAAFSQKHMPLMATIRPVVDLDAQQLHVSCDNRSSKLSIPLHYVPNSPTRFQQIYMYGRSDSNCVQSIAKVVNTTTR